jgi:stage III sporulation protein AB
MWIKFIGCILIIILSYMIGIIYSNTYRDRVKELGGFEKVIHEFENQIIYALTPIPEIVKGLKAQLNEPLKYFLSRFEENLSSGDMTIQIAWKNALDKSKGKFNLKAEDYEVIIWFGNQFGNSDKETQVKNMEFTLEKLKGQIKIAEKAREKNGKLYKSLGLAAGIFIAIIIL